MISRSAGLTTPAWQRAQADAVSSVGELLDLLRLDPELLEPGLRAAGGFPLRVPRRYVAKMRPADPRDPLLLQVLPTLPETRPTLGFERDPLRESVAATAPGLLHKYRGRALLVVTGACAIHCRYCFRRHFPYAEHLGAGDGWTLALDQVTTDASIEEVILSGGDPLSLPDPKLAELATAIAAIPHVRRLRLHTRVPVVLPERVGDELVAWLHDTRLQTVVVLHANHAREIDGAFVEAMGRLRDSGAVLLNQSVLLAGVNDSVGVLRDLSEALLAAAVLPYYLHLLDPVDGAAHFEVDEGRARRLMGDLTRQLPGYLVPKLVREVPGAPAKRMAFPAVASSLG